MDFSVFRDPEFDLKQWINEALKPTSEEHDVQEKATDLFLQIQGQMKEVMVALDRTRQDIMITIPRVLREVEALKADAVALGSELDQLHASFKQMNTSSDPVIARLIELDQARKTAQATANALQEAVRWTNLVNTIEELLESGELEQACCSLEGMEQCLTSLTLLPDYSERIVLVERHKNTLEALIVPQLMRALDHTTSDAWSRLDDTVLEDQEATQFVNLLTRIGREAAAKTYYTNWLKSQFGSYWGKSNQMQNGSITPTLHRFVAEMLLIESSESPNNTFLSGENSSQTTHSVTSVLLVFYASVLRLFEHQLRCNLFGSSHTTVVMKAFTDAFKSLHSTLTTSIFGSFVDSTAPENICRIDQVATLLKISLKCCSLLGAILNSQFQAGTNSITDKSADHLTSEQLALTILTPFSSIVDVFGHQLRKRYEDELSKIHLNTAEQPNFLDGLVQTVSSSFQLIDTSVQCCFNFTMGMGLPYLLSSIQFYWTTLLAKWTIAIDRSGEYLINADTKTGHSQTSGFACVLRVATLTGELSLKMDAYVENLLTKSANFLSNVFSHSDSSPLLGSGIFSANLYTDDWKSVSSSDWALLNQLALSLPSDCRDAMQSITHSSARMDHPDSSTTPHLQSNLNGLHRTNVTTCRAAVLMMRRVALAPIRQILQPVPTLSAWSSSPDSGEATLPDLAYLPQDYITRIGQYLFTLFEHLEPHMSNGSDPESTPSTESDQTPTPTQALTECLHLGDFEATCASAKTTSTSRSETESQVPNLRRRLRSLTLDARKCTEVNESLPVFRWFENFVSNSTCDLLVKCFLHIGDTAIVHAENKSTSSQRGRNTGREKELESHELLTPHGIKQLEADLDYFRHLMDDLGLTFPGHLQALRELISCPAEQFASLSASRPPAIVHAITRLRGL